MESAKGGATVDVDVAEIQKGMRDVIRQIVATSKFYMIFNISRFKPHVLGALNHWNTK